MALCKDGGSGSGPRRNAELNASLRRRSPLGGKLPSF